MAVLLRRFSTLFGTSVQGRAGEILRDHLGSKTANMRVRGVKASAPPRMRAAGVRLCLQRECER